MSNRERARSDMLCHVVLTIEWIASCGRAGGFQLSIHRVCTGCAILMQTGSGPSLSITRCHLCHLPYSRDPLLDLSRLKLRRASFHIWIALLISFTLLYLSFLPLFLSLSHALPLSLAIFHLFAFTLCQDKILHTFPRGTNVEKYARVTTMRYVNKRMHALVQTRS